MKNRNQTAGLIPRGGLEPSVRFPFTIERTLDLYNYGRRLQRKIAVFEESRDPNLEKIVEFAKYLTAENLSAARVWKYMVILNKVSDRLEKNFDSVTKKDIQDLVSAINTSSYKEWTKSAFKVIIKRFWKWLKNSEEYPEEVKWIKTTCKQKDRISVKREGILTPDEAASLVENCTCIRDKAMVMTLFESGSINPKRSLVALYKRKMLCLTS